MFSRNDQFNIILASGQRGLPDGAPAFLYSVILTEYVAIEPRVCVCMCVCVCACMCLCMCVCIYVCDSATAQTDGWILMKFSTNDLTDICEVRFSRILKIRNRWRHGGHFALFRWGTLMVAILLRFSSKLLGR